MNQKRNKKKNQINKNLPPRLKNVLTVSNRFHSIFDCISDVPYISYFFSSFVCQMLTKCYKVSFSIRFPNVYQSNSYFQVLNLFSILHSQIPPWKLVQQFQWKYAVMEDLSEGRS